MQKGFNIGWEIGQIDERKLEKFISKPWATDGKHFSERIWNSRTQLVSELHNQLTRTCILGKPPDDAIKAISKKFNTSKNQAGRLVMTEQAYFHSVAQQEAFKELDVEEFEVVATLDNLTSEICQEMDGKHSPMKDYEPGVTAPPFHPWCRSVTVPYFDDDFDVGERAARGADGETYYVPSDMKYSEWKEQYVDNTRENVIIKSAKDNGINGVVNINPKPLNLKNYSFDNTHINAQRQHNVTREEAEKFMNEAAVSLTRWNGQFVNYYGENGAVYIDTKNKVVKTAFKKEEFDEKINNFMKVVLNDGK